uniref:Uncharacterized protein n=1 Tax=Anguilla anguilla TaxID=7936 RepID=A0A0E9UG64_ANGAN
MKINMPRDMYCYKDSSEQDKKKPPKKTRGHSPMYQQAKHSTALHVPVPSER